jgi:hypothetical protein
LGQFENSFCIILRIIALLLNSLKHLKMKKFKFITFCLALFVSVAVNAQKPEQKAKKFADEITKVLSLTEEESTSIYQIQLARFTENKAIEKQYADDPDGKKQKLKVLGDRVFNEMKKVLGEERQKQWKEYKTN